MEKPDLISSDDIYRDTYIRVVKDVLRVGDFSWSQVYLSWNNIDSVCAIPYEDGGSISGQTVPPRITKLFLAVPRRNNGERIND